MQNSMVMFILSVFDWKYPFWANLVQKVKIISWSWNLVARLIRIWRIQWWCSFFLFLIGNILFGQIWSKKSNYQLKLKFGSQTNSNMQNSMVMFILSVFDWKCPFWANLVQKVKIVSWSWNLVARLIQICRIQWCCFIFFVFEWKYLFRGNLVQKFKIVTLSRNLVPTLIRTCIIQRCYSLFLFLSGNTLFGQICSKKSKLSVEAEIW